MSNISTCCIQTNQWIKGWNIGRYGRAQKNIEVRQKTEEWRLGYISGVRGKKEEKRAVNSKIKHLMCSQIIPLNIS